MVVLDYLSYQVLTLNKVGLEGLHNSLVLGSEVDLIDIESLKSNGFDLDGIGVGHVEAEEILAENFTINQFHYLLLHRLHLTKLIFNFDVLVDGALPLLYQVQFVLALALLDGPLPLYEVLRFE